MINAGIQSTTTTDTRPAAPTSQSMSSKSGTLKGIPAGNFVIIWRGNDEMYQAINLMKAGVEFDDISRVEWAA
jgi:hypothetical protein